MAGILKRKKDMGTKEIILPDGWEVKEAAGNKIVIREKGKELPKTWGGGATKAPPCLITHQ